MKKKGLTLSRRTRPYANQQKVLFIVGKDEEVGTEFFFDCKIL